MRKTLNWVEYYMGFAEHAALKSKDPSTQVGAVAVGTSGQILTTGFNGLARGVKDAPERYERPQKYTWIIHAEANLVANAARCGICLDGSTVYVTHRPCPSCSDMLIQSGVKTIVIGSGTTKTPPELYDIAKQKLQESMIKTFLYDEVRLYPYLME